MNTTKLTRFLSYAAGVIILLVPFQALLTTWAGANFGHIDLIRIWKELLLVPVCLASLWLVFKDKRLKAWFVGSRLVMVILLYVLLQLAIGSWALASHHVNSSALIYALIINLRFLVFFLVCMVLAARYDWLSKNWLALIIGPAVLVIAFGWLQHFVLPNNFLSHFGYGPKTIPAYQTVDHKPQYVRLQSTLRGPNPLGAYLAVILTVFIGLWQRQKRRLTLGLSLLAGLVALYFTYSRSAWLGFFAGGLLLIIWQAKSRQTRRLILLVALGLALITVGSVLLWSQNSVLENTLFHTSHTSQSPESSNAVRTEAMLTGAKSIVKSPLGSGPGTAGPASFRNSHSARIAENYFIQVGQEVGVLGLILFVLINVYLAKALWHNRQDYLCLVVLAGLMGLSLVNLLSHAWADDTLAYIFWGLAGIALAPSVIMNKERKHQHGQTQEKTS